MTLSWLPFALELSFRKAFSSPLEADSTTWPQSECDLNFIRQILLHHRECQDLKLKGWDRYSGRWPEPEIWEADIHGFYTSPVACGGVHRGFASHTAKSQRTKYIWSAIVRFQTPQFYRKPHVVRHFPKWSERSKNVPVENLTSPFSIKFHSTPQHCLHFLKIFTLS